MKPIFVSESFSKSGRVEDGNFNSVILGGIYDFSILINLNRWMDE